MKDVSPTLDALGRAGRRAAIHLVQAMVESLKAVEAVIEELSSIGNGDRRDQPDSSHKRIEIE